MTYYCARGVDMELSCIAANIAIIIVSFVSITFITLWLKGLITVGALIAVFAGLFFVFFIVPLIYRWSYSFQRNLLFLSFVSVPVDFENPSKLRLLGARNVYLKTNDNVTLGLWHVLPASKLPGLLLTSVTQGQAEDSNFDSWLGQGEPIVMYMHGNSGNRGAGHRVELYKVLQLQNYHVIAFDYRGYGDSSATEPSEDGVVSDTKAVYKWVKERARNSKIIFWGHSLGTGISSHALRDLESEGEKISALILECPFNNMRDEVRNYPLAKVFHILPWFDFFFTDPMYDNGLRFESDKHLSQVRVPILILHAEDDVVVPFKLGKKLYETLQDKRGQNQLLKFISFNKELHHGHKLIYRDQRLPDIVRNFVTESLEYKPT